MTTAQPLSSIEKVELRPDDHGHAGVYAEVGVGRIGRDGIYPE